MRKVKLRGRLKHIFTILVVIMILSGCAALTEPTYLGDVIPVFETEEQRMTSIMLFVTQFPLLRKEVMR